MLPAAIAVATASTDGLAVAPPPIAPAAHRYALLVGTNDGGPQRTPLRYAHDDAVAVADVLRDLGGLGEDRTTLLYDPDVARVRGAFDALAERIADDPERTEVVFYYSGHSDEEGLRLGPDLLSWRELRERLDGLGADLRLAVLDSCASGSLILAKGGTAAPAFVTPGGKIEGFAYITSSSADEVSQEGERIGGSYFTHYLTTGLRGAADASGDGRVTLHEAYVFAREATLSRTERTSHGPQHANYAWQLEGSGELVLTDLERRTSALVLGPDVVGRASVRDESGALVAELEALGGAPVTFGLPPGPYAVTVTREGAYLEGEVWLEEGTSTAVSLGDLATRLGESTVTRGGPLAELPDLLPRGARFPVDAGELPAEPRQDSFVLGAVAGRSWSLDGVGAAPLAYRVDGRAEGVVASLGVTGAGELAGWQSSLLANRAGTGLGAQTTLGVNVVERGFDGHQFAVVANSATNGIRGVQVAAGVNLAPGGVRGAEVAIVNAAGGRVEGLQVGVIDLAADVSGVQIGPVTAARDIKGAQIGLLNVGRDVTGVQLGLVNVARSSAGVPIGLLSFVKEGRHALLLGTSDAVPVLAELKLGAAFHTALAAGWDPDRAVLGRVGFGLHGARDLGGAGALWADLDSGVAASMPLGRALRRSGLAWGDALPVLVSESRLTLGWNPVPAVGGYLGLSVSALVEDGTLPTPRDAVWPGVFGGIQLF